MVRTIVFSEYQKSPATNIAGTRINHRQSQLGGNGGVNGIAFDPKLSDEDVLGLRTYSEAFQVFERRALLAEARKWVMGT